MHEFGCGPSRHFTALRDRSLSDMVTGDHHRHKRRRHPLRFSRLLQSHREFRCSEGLLALSTLGGTSRTVSRPSNSRQPAGRCLYSGVAGTIDGERSAILRFSAV